MILSLMCGNGLQANLDESDMSSPPFLRALMTAVCKVAVKSKWLSFFYTITTESCFCLVVECNILKKWLSHICDPRQTVEGQFFFNEMYTSLYTSES